MPAAAAAAPSVPDFHESLLASLDPRTPLERFLADRLANLACRLQEAMAAATDDPASNDRLLDAERRLQPLFSRTFTQLRQLQSDRRKHPPQDRPDTTPDTSPAATPDTPHTRAPAPQTHPEIPAPQREGEAPPEPRFTRGASLAIQTQRAPLPPHIPTPFIDQADPTPHLGNSPADILRRAQSYALAPILNRKRKPPRG